MATNKLVSFKLCPFVQRSVITLEETNTPYEITYIDLSDKPEWFLKISPFGKVPVLQVGDTSIFESAVINEYLDEVSQGDSLHPADPLQKAENRAWIEFVSGVIVDQYRLMIANDEESYKAAASDLRKKLERLEGRLDDGPFFNGADFSLVDAAIAPYFQRAVWAAEIDPDLNSHDALPKIQTWSDALVTRKSVQDSVVSDLRDIFRNYLKGDRGANSQTDPSFLGQKL